MKPVSILFLSMVVVIAAVCSAEIDDPSHAKAVPMKLEDIKIQQTFNKFGPKFGLTPILLKNIRKHFQQS
uniref:Uncharacterized protein n=1 Tax=Panagrolaimus davidi TaxID=227884 RepID=A0A914QMJ1_9BILA